MTPWDNTLLKKARTTPYWKYNVVFELIEMADTQDCKYKLNNIGEILYEIYTNRGDPKEKEKVRGMWQRCRDLFTRTV